MGSLHLVGGEKGGVGKSWLARLMAHTLSDGPEFVLIDSDQSNPTLANFYQSAIQIPFSDHPKHEDLSDEVFDYAIESNVIVNLPAGAHAPVSRWIAEKSVFRQSERRAIALKHWFVTDGEDDSLSLFARSVNHYDGKLPHVLVLNQGRCDDWNYFNERTDIQELIELYSIPVVELPKLGDYRRIKLNAQRFTFQEAMEFKGFGVLGQAQIEQYLEEVHQVLTEGGFFEVMESSSKAATPTLAASNAG